MQFRAGVIDEHGRLLGLQEFSANDHGRQALLTWMRGHDIVSVIGVESTGSFGATLTRMLTKVGEHVIEVGRLNTPSNVTTADDKTTSTGAFWNQ